MKQYIGTKIVHAQPAFKATGVRKDCKVANQVLTPEQLEDCKASGWEFTDLKEGYEVRLSVCHPSIINVNILTFGTAKESMVFCSFPPPMLLFNKYIRLHYILIVTNTIFQPVSTREQVANNTLLRTKNTIHCCLTIFKPLCQTLHSYSSP